MAMQMPVMDGVEATSLIHAEHPQIQILGLSSFTTQRYVVDLLRAGASGFLVEDSEPEHIIWMSTKISRGGESVLSHDVTSYVVRGLERLVAANVEPDPVLMETLTEKELEVIRLLAEGKSNKEMAEELFLAESSIKARFAQILVIAVKAGLVLLDPPA